jgi:hypothetical protein
MNAKLASYSEENEKMVAHLLGEKTKRLEGFFVYRQVVCPYPIKS